MKRAQGKCPHCGRSFFNYNQNEWKYGSPIKTCKKCKQKYLDTRYHEIIIDGFEPNEFFNTRKILVGFAIGAVALVISIVFNSITIFTVGLIGMLFMIVMSIDFITIKTGHKKRRLEKLKMESFDRLLDKKYAYELYSAGYNVPQEFLE